MEASAENTGVRRVVGGDAPAPARPVAAQLRPGAARILAARTVTRLSPCDRCGRAERTMGWPVGRICYRCHDAAIRSDAACGGCGVDRFVCSKCLGATERCEI